MITNKLSVQPKNSSWKRESAMSSRTSNSTILRKKQTLKNKLIEGKQRFTNRSDDRSITMAYSLIQMCMPDIPERKSLLLWKRRYSWTTQILPPSITQIHCLQKLLQYLAISIVNGKYQLEFVENDRWSFPLKKKTIFVILFAHRTHLKKQHWSSSSTHRKKNSALLNHCTQKPQIPVFNNFWINVKVGKETWIKTTIRNLNETVEPHNTAQFMFLKICDMRHAIFHFRNELFVTTKYQIEFYDDGHRIIRKHVKKVPPILWNFRCWQLGLLLHPHVIVGYIAIVKALHFRKWRKLRGFYALRLPTTDFKRFKLRFFVTIIIKNKKNISFVFVTYFSELSTLYY